MSRIVFQCHQFPVGMMPPNLCLLSSVVIASNMSLDFISTSFKCRFSQCLIAIRHAFFCKVPHFYPRAMRCGGDIVTLLWFRPSFSVCVCPSRFNLVNMIETKSFCAS